ncbi:hypothetical protein PENSPDRAFT_451724 [Peniophora sp. CONT]|nr:hypothetical protein PENSPDRAFT_451724 [Peniophora sp. CONT]
MDRYGRHIRSSATVRLAESDPWYLCPYTVLPTTIIPSNRISGCTLPHRSFLYKGSQLARIGKGRIALKQTTIKKTSVTSGDAVEHKICVAEGTLLVVLEVPRVSQDEVDNVAQLFKAMLSATHVHRDVSPDRQLRVYGLLTDSLKFEFFSYDPVTRKFSCDASLLAALGYQEEIFELVIPVTNKIFSILLSGYIGLVRNRALETARSEVNYDLALTLAEKARGLFTQEVTTNGELEVQMSKALDVLRQSISIVPRETDMGSDEQEPVSVQEPAQMAGQLSSSFRSMKVTSV